MQRKIMLCGLCLCLLLTGSATLAEAAQKPVVQEIIFVPHDSRPISNKQTTDVVKKLGYEVVVPPDELLGKRNDLGHPDELWQWVDQEMKRAKKNKDDVKAVVFSSDAMLYGSLVGSRKHDYTKQQVLQRAERFAEFRKQHPKTRVYAFGSIMRTPKNGEAAGPEEPAYYQSYGGAIFRYTALTDKQETEQLTKRETKERQFLQKLVPQDVMNDWMNRRHKNFLANQYLIDLTRRGVFDYLTLGRDDNAPYSQTHVESRKLAKQGEDLGVSKFQAMAGIDEIGLLMLTRAVNDFTGNVPFVNVRYNWGAGPRIIPSYSDESIDSSIRAHVTAAGGIVVSQPEKADFVLMVNTNPNGKTYEANYRNNDGSLREGTKFFADLVQDYLKAGYPVGIGDVAFANGADNALLEELRKRNLLFKIKVYSGWNTATNSTGFAIGEGILTTKMTKEACDALLLQRYLDDWAYQANVRQVIARQLGWFRGNGIYTALNERKLAAEQRASSLLQRFAADNLPPVADWQQLRVVFPWNRMFEADVQLQAAQ